jgi:hypothetical protein
LPTRYPFRYTIRSQPTVAGARVDTDAVAVKNPTSFDFLRGISNLSSPLPIVNSVATEGADSPIYTRDLLASWYPSRHWIAQRAKAWQISIASALGLGLSTPIAAAPPDDTPVAPITKFLDWPMKSWRARVKQAYRSAAAATIEAPGAWIAILPATDYTVTVCEILSEIQAHLLETVDGGLTFGSGLWTVAEVMKLLNARLSRFLVETGIMIYRTTQAALETDIVYNLPTDLIDLRRVAWTTGGTTNVLPRMDAEQADLWNNMWESQTANGPQGHMQFPEESLEIRLAPQPNAAGTLDFLYVKNFTPLVADCSIIPFPDEWSWAVKYGVLADMLSKEGEANDPERASYCEQRFNEAVELARLYLGTQQ